MAIGSNQKNLQTSILKPTQLQNCPRIHHGMHHSLRMVPMVACGRLELPLTKPNRWVSITIMDKKLIAKVMAELGSRTSKAKAAAARENGKKGGRPRKPKTKRGAR
jgi:hypothetical protein